jgi:hypothetical protein
LANLISSSLGEAYDDLTRETFALCEQAHYSSNSHLKGEFLHLSVSHFDARVGDPFEREKVLSSDARHTHSAPSAVT